MFVSYDRDTTDLASKAVGYDRANEDKFLFFFNCNTRERGGAKGNEIDFSFYFLLWVLLRKTK